MDDSARPLVSYRTIKDPVHIEIVEKKSRFLCGLYPVDGEQEALHRLALARKEHWNASHHCSAYRLRDGAARANDDGEPSGTAGRPMLRVLEQQNITDVMAIVTRYFGGVLLGAGGLTRAYGGAVAHALSQAALVVYEPHDSYRFSLEYGQYELAHSLFATPGWQLTAEFAERVLCHLTTPAADRSTVASTIVRLTHDPEAASPVATALRPLRQE